MIERIDRPFTGADGGDGADHRVIDRAGLTQLPPLGRAHNLLEYPPVYGEGWFERQVLVDPWSPFMKAPEEIADQSGRGAQLLACTADRRRQTLVSLDRAIELLDVVGVMLQRLCPVGDGVSRNIAILDCCHGSHRVTTHRAGG